LLFLELEEEQSIFLSMLLAVGGAMWNLFAVDRFG
jgi:hypothetical protein